jgi:hypothetical protein
VATRLKNGKAVQKAASNFQEIGVAGGGANFMYNTDYDFVPELRGTRGIKTYREMRDNDATVGAIMAAMDMVLRGVEWRTEPSDENDQAAIDAAEFADSLRDDMSHTWEDFISEVMTFLTYGFAFHEIVYKKREGPNQKDPKRKSKYDDGRIGVRKLAPRAQWTLQDFTFDDDGGIQAFVQDAAYGRAVIPMDKGLLFRTVTANNNPMGRSVLRNAFKSWYMTKHMQDAEAIAVERELNGLPVGRIPSAYLAPNATAEQTAIRTQFERQLRDLKNNSQGYWLGPSDTYVDAQGKPTDIRLVDIELMASNGTRNIDVGAVIVRYQRDIARTVLADFVMLGQSETGSFALSKSKTDLFLSALEGYLSIIASVLNRFLLPRVFALNGMDQRLLPRYVHGQVAPANLAELGDFLQKAAASGMPLFPDEQLENQVRDMAGLTERPDDFADLLADGVTPDE